MESGTEPWLPCWFAIHTSQPPSPQFEGVIGVCAMWVVWFGAARASLALLRSPGVLGEITLEEYGAEAQVLVGHGPHQ